MFVETSYNLTSTARCPLCGAAVTINNINYSLAQTSPQMVSYKARCKYEHLFIVLLNKITDVNAIVLCLREDLENMGVVHYKWDTVYTEGNYDV